MYTNIHLFSKIKIKVVEPAMEPDFQTMTAVGNALAR